MQKLCTIEFTHLFTISAYHKTSTGSYPLSALWFASSINVFLLQYACDSLAPFHCYTSDFCHLSHLKVRPCIICISATQLRDEQVCTIWRWGKLSPVDITVMLVDETLTIDENMMHRFSLCIHGMLWYWCQANGRIVMSSPGRLQLSIRRLLPEDNGTYVCRSRNSAGSDEQTASLVVNCEFLVNVVML